MPEPKKLRHSMPRSIYDLTASNYPDIATHAREVAARHEGAEYVIPFEDYPWNHSIIQKAAERAMRRQESPYFYGDQALWEGYLVNAAWSEWQLANLNIHGRQTFFVHENIVPLLATTQINIDADSFQLPAPACLFVFDDDETRRLAYANDPDPLTSRKAPISVALFWEKSLAPDGIADISILAEHADEMRSYCTWKRRVVLRPGSTLDQSLRKPFTDEEMELINREAGVSDDERVGGDYLKESDFQGKDFDFIRMVMNTALYLTSRGADLSEPVEAPKRGQYATLPKGQRLRLEAAAATKSKLSYIYVGRNAQPVEVERDEYEIGEGRKLSKRFRVRAHPRWQRVGPGRSEIRLTDVKAHWKGPEAAEVLHRRTVLKLHPDAIPDEAPEDDNVAPAPGM